MSGKRPFINRASVRPLLTIAALFALLSVTYTNCGDAFPARNFAEELGSNSGGGGPTGGTQLGKDCLTDKELFKQTFWGFATTNCKSCHVPGGMGKGAFASSNIDEAFSAFKLIPVTKVVENATGSHQSPFTGPQHVAAINSMVTSVQTNQSICAQVNQPKNPSASPSPSPTPLVLDDSPPADAVVTEDRILPLLSTEQTIAYDFGPGGDIVKNGSASFASVGFELKVTYKAKGQAASGRTIYEYQVRLPSIRPGNVNIHVDAIYVVLNGKEIRTATTYSRLNRDVPAGSAFVPLATGAAMIFEYEAEAAANNFALSFRGFRVTP